ncbi:hypothetical protein D8B26_006693 [Coccidioides posadasii str. Silveira]|uniref:Uncharacterized protein n=2 Tax=Coccidioides posadasii TaxID=199306 RepID=E9CR50_COCPS|nr:conserved hypothetical protein [Coccidioides posadasii str. Silveira]QVM12057.1 hypothetical protein D8B26_006693 [Coccidioides posadasii str. Silveira]
MGKKLPNYRFSKRKGRTVSKTQSIIDNAIARFSRRYSTYKDTMPSGSRVAPAARSELYSKDAQIVIEEQFQTVMDSFQRLFGIFSVVNKSVYYRDLLHLEQVMGAELDKETHLRNLTNAVSAVSQTKDEEIRKLAEENERLKTEHETFEENKKTFKAEKEEFEKKCRDMEKNYKSREEELEERFKNKYKTAEELLKKRVEREKKAVEEKVESELEELKFSNAELKMKLETKMSESELKIERYEAYEKLQKEKINDLESKLQVVDPSYAMSKKSSTYYHEIFGRFSDRIAKIADDHFGKSPPEDHINIMQLLGQQHRLSEVSEIFNYASSSETEVAANLRKCAIRHFIASQVAKVLMNSPFSPRTSDGHRDNKGLQAIHDSSKLNNHQRMLWRMITLRAIDSRAGFTAWAKELSAEAMEKIQCLVENKQHSKIKRELASLFEFTLDVWDVTMRDGRNLVINTHPPSKNNGTWKFIDNPLPFSNGNGSTTATAVPRVVKPESFAIFPRITGEFEEEGKNEDMKEEILHPGIGLFSDSPVFELGLREFRELKREVNNSHKRHASISSPIIAEPQQLSLDTGAGRPRNGST